jgi:hypothetical protein
MNKQYLEFTCPKCGSHELHRSSLWKTKTETEILGIDEKGNPVINESKVDVMDSIPEDIYECFGCSLGVGAKETFKEFVERGCNAGWLKIKSRSGK